MSYSEEVKVWMEVRVSSGKGEEIMVFGFELKVLWELYSELMHTSDNISIIIIINTNEIVARYLSRRITFIVV